MEKARLERETPAVEVSEKPLRRRFSTEYKVRILAEADGCTKLGQLGELLRREGLYSSLLSTWRRQRDEGMLAGLTPKRRGRKVKTKNPLANDVARLERENLRLTEKLRQAELIIDVQKKVSEMLNIGSSGSSVRRHN
ncbi:MAG: transposase [Candidatus Hydrogenedentes bacterium]|nr:transposase [Candidatus Hydrogenedentota bacterium]